ncbi:MAG: hypothetical protein E6L08_02430 [Verrucomicrobia bacterium]|nr:MAG: hypothetical protein E6L08_02430 [Verrucomicrobiota bacterium]
MIIVSNFSVQELQKAQAIAPRNIASIDIVAARREQCQSPALLIGDYLRSRFARLDLRTHLLDLLGLFFQGRGQGFNFLLLQGNSGFLFCTYRR